LLIVELINIGERYLFVLLTVELINTGERYLFGLLIVELINTGERYLFVLLKVVLINNSTINKTNKYHSPVLINSEFCFVQFGIMRPTNMDTPSTAKFLLELRSTYCRLANISPIKMPKPTDTNVAKYMSTKETLLHLKHTFSFQDRRFRDQSI
jgi:hypothetical protein